MGLGFKTAEIRDKWVVLTYVQGRVDTSVEPIPCESYDEALEYAKDVASVTPYADELEQREAILLRAEEAYRGYVSPELILVKQEK